MRFVAASLALVAACSPGASAVPLVDTAGIRREVLAVADSISGGYRANDAEAILRHVDQHADYVSAGDGVYGTDAQADAAGMRAFYAGRDHHKYLAFDNLDRRVAVLAPDVAVFNNHYRETLLYKTGDTARIRGTYTLVFVRRNGHWKARQQYFSHCAAADTVACARP